MLDIGYRDVMKPELEKSGPNAGCYCVDPMLTASILLDSIQRQRDPHQAWYSW